MKTYPNITPSVSNGVLSFDRLAAAPGVVRRRLTDLTQSRFLGEVLLSGREQAPTGAVVVEREDGAVAVLDDPVEIGVGSEAEIVRIGDGTEVVVHTSDRFVAVEVSYKAARRFPSTTTNRALNLIANRLILQSETRALAEIKASSGSGNFTGQTTDPNITWNTTNNIAYPVFQAIEDMESRELGLSPTALVLDTSVAAIALGNEKVAAFYAREDKSNPIYTGNHPVIAGLPVLISNRLNSVAGIKAAVVDTANLGGIATEEALDGRVIDDQRRRVYVAQAVKSDVPFVQQPLAIQAIDVT